MEQDAYGDFSPPVEWPGPALEDPAKGYHRRELSSAWFNKPIHKATRNATDPAVWEKHWGADACWEDPSEGGEFTPALLALRACLYKAGEGSAVHAQSVLDNLSSGTIPQGVVDAWGEPWMRLKFVESLVRADPKTPLGQLAECVLEKWPWVFVLSGRQNQSYQHPLCQAVKRGNYGFAEKLMRTIPSEQWVDWSHHYDLSGIWRESEFWFKQDPSWLLKLASIDPKLMEIVPAFGIGPLERAAKDHLPGIVRGLLDAGFEPDVNKSFGLSLSHWAVLGVSEFQWDQRANEFKAKNKQSALDNAQRCGTALAELEAMGYGMDVPVVKVAPTPGVRRKPGLPKPPATASTMLDFRRWADPSAPAPQAPKSAPKLREKDALSEETMSTIYRFYLEASQNHARPIATAPAAKTRRL